MTFRFVLSLQFFFVCLPLSSSKNSSKLDDDEKKNNKNTDAKKVRSFITHQKIQSKKHESKKKYLSVVIFLFRFRSLSFLFASSSKVIHSYCVLCAQQRYHSKRENDLLSSSSASFVTRRDNNNNNSNAHVFVCSKIWKKTNTKNNNNNIDNNIFKSNKKRFNRLGRTERPV